MKIKDLVKVFRGSSPRPIIDYLTNSWYRRLKISDFSIWDKFVYDTKEFIKPEWLKNTRYVKKWTLILTNSATPWVPVFLWEDMCLHDWFLYFENLDDSVLDIEYLYCWFLINRLNIINLANGSVFKNLKKEIVENLEIDLPSLNIQQKIVWVFNKINNKIILNNQINHNLQNYIDSIFNKRFVEYSYPDSDWELKESELWMIPINWNITTFDSIMKFSNWYWFNTEDMSDEEINNSYKIFKMWNIKTEWRIDKSKTKSWILKDKCIWLEKFISKKWDILMCMTDMKASVSPLLWHTALIDRDGEFIINQRVWIVRAYDEIWYPFVYTMTNNQQFLERIRSKANSWVQVNLSTKGICETKLVLPTKDLIDKFNFVTEPIYEKMFNNDNENESLSTIRDTLLPKLMNWEINLDNVTI